MRPGLLLPLLLSGCLVDDLPKGLRRTPAGEGARVVYDLEATPLPDIPLPNDVLTRADRQSPTGRRLNLSLVAPTELEAELRRQAFELDGFGTFAPITVRFSAPLDPRTVTEDGVLLLDVTDGPHFGERFVLDIGRERFPLTLPSPDAYFDQDPRAGEDNLLFETVDEDTDGDGRLGVREDTDGDGRLDRPNGPNWYERETRTLVLRPLEPLRPGRTYAVVLTDALEDAKGRPVRSPFVWVHHNRQTEALRRLPEALQMHGRGAEEVAFTWTFTTQSATRDLLALRRGLNGRGDFATLGDEFPPDVTRVEPMRALDTPEAALLRTEALQEVLRALLPQVLPEAAVEPVVATYDAVEYLVSAQFVTPYLLVDDDGDEPTEHGGYPADEDEVFRLDYETKTAMVGGAVVAFWCTVPKGARPAPVVLHAHRFGRSRADMFAVAGVYARHGFATCALDSAGHGVAAVADVPEPVRRAVLGPRARDLTNDGVPDPGGDTFTPDALHSRDMVRQTALDWLQLIRVLRAFDGQRRWGQPGVEGDVAGDFDADGVVDLGGPGVDYHLTGTGFGGMVATIVAALAPEVVSVAPVAGGGGLVDIALRSDAPGIPESFVLGALGPLVVGYPDLSATTASFLVAEANRLQHADPELRRGLPFATLPPLVPGDEVRLTNRRSGEVRSAVVNGEGGFRISVPADGASATRLRVKQGLRPWRVDFEPKRLVTTEGVGDPLRLEVFDSAGRLRKAVEVFEQPVTLRGVIYDEGPLVAVTSGFGLRRQSPRLRQHTQIMQTMLEAADPLNYARLLLREPVERPTDTLVLLTGGDTEVPVSAGMALARAAGLLTLEEDDEAFAAGVARLPSEGAPVEWSTEKVFANGRGAVKVVVLDEAGTHGFHGPTTDAADDAGLALAELLAGWFEDRGLP